jgi:hypothetical protein
MSEGAAMIKPASSASVALDIGAGHGALVIYPHERYRGLEIEISPVVTDGRRVHTGVHERGSAAGARLTAVFGSLPAGEYIVWRDAEDAGPRVSVPDGSIAEMTLE